MSGGPSPAPALVGVVFLPEGFDASVSVAGLGPVLRHCLALQSAGVEAVHVVGDAAALPSDPRLRVELRTDSPVGPEAAALVVRGDWTYHRALLPRLGLLGVAADQVLAVEDSHAPGHGVFLCGPAAVAGLLSALASDGEPPSSPTPMLEGEFVVPSGTPAQARNALRLHLASLVKSTAGLVDRYFARRFSLQLTRLLISSPVTPNMVTLFSLLVALVSAGMVGFDEPRIYIAGALLHFSVRIIDCVDGELARLRYQGSDFGAFLDTISDGIGLTALVAAVTFRLRDVDDGMWLYLGLAGIALYLAVQVLQLTVARRATGSGSLQGVEWGFQQQSARGVDRIVGLLHPLMRHDFISTLYVVAIILDLLRPLLVGHAIASLAGVVYLAAQLPRKLNARTQG